MDLLLINKDDLVRDITVKSTLDYSVYKIAEFKILRGMRRMSSKIKLKIKKSCRNMKTTRLNSKLCSEPKYK